MYDEKKYYDICNEKINNIIANKNCSEIKITELKLGQHIYIIFSSDSQKYMDTLYPKCGYIKTITINKNYDHLRNTYNDYYNIEIINYNNDTEYLLHDSVGGIYSQDLGYCYTIYLIE
jgi:hypothetical protein